MHFRSLFLLQLFLTSYADNTHIIRDYFVFKNVTRVAGISCANIFQAADVIRLLNKAGIAASIKPFEAITNITTFLHTHYWNLGILLDLNCPFEYKDIKELFYQTTLHHMFDHLHQWLILGNNMSHTIEIINDKMFSIITDVVIVIPRNGDYVLYDVYNHCKHCGGLLNINSFGTWTEDNGLTINLPVNKFFRRWNYNKLKVKMAGIVGARPKDKNLEHYLQELTTIRTDNWAKYGYSIMLHVSDMFNFSSKWIELTYWAKNDNNGPLMGGLKDGLYDLGYYPSILTNERLNLAEVILQVWPVRTCFMFLTVPALKRDMDIIFRPFEKNVWYMVLLLTILIIFILWATLKAEKNSPECARGETVLIIVAALCQQGLPDFSNQFASRIAFLQTMIFGLLVYNCYSAAIVSSRLNTPLNKMNDSLFALVKSKLNLAAYKDIYFNLLLRSPSREVQYFRRHWETIPEKSKFFSIEEGVKRITNPGFAYHANPVNAYPLIERIFDKQMICQLTEVHLLRPTSLGLWAPRHGHFQEIAKIGLIRITTSGIQKREILRWSYRTPYCNKDKHYVSSVTFGETIPIIFILIFGILLSAVICLMEIIIFRLMRKKTKKNINIGNQSNGKCAHKKLAAENITTIEPKMFMSNNRPN